MNPHRTSAFDQRLLRAARAELPAAGAEERALAALGLASMTAPEVPTGGVHPSGSPGLAQTWSLKWIATALVAGGAAIFVATWAPTHSTPAPPTPATVAPAPTAAAPALAALPTAAAPPTVPTAPATKPLPATRARKTAISLSPPHAAVSPPDSSPDASPSTLSSEVVLVQQATQALARGDSGSALAVLSTYENRYSHGTLAPEAGYLRVQALLARGDRAAAIDLATRLFAADPKGVLAPKLEAVMESEEKPIP